MFDTAHPLLIHLSPLLATQARRRMVVLAASAVLFLGVFSGMEVLLPLWATRELGMSAGEWAQLRSLRMGGITVGVVVLGALSDRFGQRMLAAWSMFAVALLIVLMALGGKGAVWLAMPLFGACFSTGMVNMNTLIQQVSERRQGVANTIYRSIGAATGIVAPVLVTGLALVWHGYPSVMLLGAGLIVIAGLVMLRYPGEATAPPLGALRMEIARLWAAYRTALRQRELLRFFFVSMTWGNLLAGIGAFVAIRYTAQLHTSDPYFGLVNAAGGLAALLATVAAGFFLDRVSLRRLHGVGGLVASLCSVVMGLTDAVSVTTVALVLFSALASMLIAPTSMWVSRAAGAGTQIAAFSVHKVTSALYLGLTMVLLSWLEGQIGIRAIFFWGGITSAIVAMAFFLLPEPPRTH